jgi:hypothetical protein
VSLVTSFDPFSHPTHLLDWFTSVFVYFLQEFASEAFQQVGAIFPEGLAFWEVS